MGIRGSKKGKEFCCCDDFNEEGNGINGSGKHNNISQCDICGGIKLSCDETKRKLGAFSSPSPSSSKQSTLCRHKGTKCKEKAKTNRGVGDSGGCAHRGCSYEEKGGHLSSRTCDNESLKGKVANMDDLYGVNKGDALKDPQYSNYGDNNFGNPQQQRDFHCHQPDHHRHKNGNNHVHSLLLSDGDGDGKGKAARETIVRNHPPYDPKSELTRTCISGPPNICISQCASEELLYGRPFVFRPSGAGRGTTRAGTSSTRGGSTHSSGAPIPSASTSTRGSKSTIHSSAGGGGKKRW